MLFLFMEGSCFAPPESCCSQGQPVSCPSLLGTFPNDCWRGWVHSISIPGFCVVAFNPSFPSSHCCGFRLSLWGWTSVDLVLHEHLEETQVGHWVTEVASLFCLFQENLGSDLVADTWLWPRSMSQPPRPHLFKGMIRSAYQSCDTR